MPACDFLAWTRLNYLEAAPHHLGSPWDLLRQYSQGLEVQSCTDDLQQTVLQEPCTSSSPYCQLTPIISCPDCSERKAAAAQVALQRRGMQDFCR